MPDEALSRWSGVMPNIHLLSYDAGWERRSPAATSGWLADALGFSQR